MYRVWSDSPEAELPLVQGLGLGELLHVCVGFALILEPAEVTVLGVFGDHGHLGKSSVFSNQDCTHQVTL